MKINLLKFVYNQENIKIYKIIEKDLYITKLDLLYGGLPLLCETVGIRLPFNYQLEEVRKLKLYKIIIKDTQEEIVLIEITEAGGVDFD